MDITKLHLGGFSFGQRTFYTSHHLGVDKRASYIDVFMPVNLFEATYTTGPQGGLTVTVTDRLGYIHRFMHLQDFLVRTKEIAARTLFAKTGNTGSLTTGPHLHWDIRKPKTARSNLSFSNFINPDVWVRDIMPSIIEQESQIAEVAALDKWQRDAIDLAQSTKVVSDTAYALKVIREAQEKPAVFLAWYIESSRKMKNNKDFK